MLSGVHRSGKVSSERRCSSVASWGWRQRWFRPVSPSPLPFTSSNYSIPVRYSDDEHPATWAFGIGVATGGFSISEIERHKSATTRLQPGIWRKRTICLMLFYKQVYWAVWAIEAENTVTCSCDVEIFIFHQQWARHTSEVVNGVKKIWMSVIAFSFIMTCRFLTRSSGKGVDLPLEAKCITCSSDFWNRIFLVKLCIDRNNAARLQIM